MAARIALVLFLLAASFSTLSAAEVDEQTRSEWRTAIRALAGPDPVLRKCATQLLEDLPIELPPRDLGNSYTLMIIALILRPDYRPVQDVIVGELDLLGRVITGKDLEAAAAAFVLIRASGESAAPLAADLKRAAANPAIDDNLRLECAMSLMFVLPRTEPAFPHFISMWSDLLAQSELDQVPAEKGPQLYGHDQNEVWSIAMAVPYLTEGIVLADRTQTEIPELVRIAQTSKSWEIRVLILQILAELEDEAVDALPHLEALLEDEDKAVRVAAAYAIMSIREDWSLATKLEPSLKLTDAELADFLHQCLELTQMELDSLKRSQGDSQSRVTSAIEILGVENSVWQRDGIIELKQLGPAARSALPILQDKLWVEDELTRRLAAEAIREIDVVVPGHEQ